MMYQKEAQVLIGAVVDYLEVPKILQKELEAALPKPVPKKQETSLPIVM